MDAILRTLALGHAAVVIGPGGIGKSRLLAEVAARAGESLVVGARPGDEIVPGALLGRLVAQFLRDGSLELDADTRTDLARLRGAIPGATAPDEPRSPAERRRALGSLARVLTNRRARGLRLLVLDDLHFADAASLEALGVLLGHWHALPADAAPQPLVGAGPGEGAPEVQALLDLLTAAGRGARIELAPWVATNCSPW